ncbi:MAG TPA: PA domain-containing protein [Trueperaceae bacterium]|nr:PA domain-containing protein [Trueperaceae bacterium]
MNQAIGHARLLVGSLIFLFLASCTPTPPPTVEWTYEGSNDQGTFVRPGGVGLSQEALTVGYHAFEFTPQSGGDYQVVSEQDYDGFLALYEGSFDPADPEKNLVDTNDDYVARGWSRIVASLTANTKYVVVTAACGDPMFSPCGDPTGSFSNEVSKDLTPPEVEEPTDEEEQDPQTFTELPAPDDSRFDITLRFWSGGFTKAEMEAIYASAERWSEIITADLEDVEVDMPEFDPSTPGAFAVTEGAPPLSGIIDDVFMDIAKYDFGDAAQNVLARAGAFYVRDGGPDDFTPLYGIMEFNARHFVPGGFFETPELLGDTVLHEMGHVLGISRAFWIPQGLITGNPPDPNFCSDIEFDDDPQYLGPNGNDAWQNVYNATTPTVPLEHINGCGTADSHWRESILMDELMTGFAEVGFAPLSEVTIGALDDLGYTVDYTKADAWTIPPVPVFRQISPVDKGYEFVWEFARPAAGSGQLTAPVTSVDLDLGPGNTSTSGCQAEDFAGFPAGDIALVQRGTCPFQDKVDNAVAAGASAVLIANQGDTDLRTKPLNVGATATIPVLPIAYEVMAELDGAVDPVVHLDLGPAALMGPQRGPRIDWGVAEVLLDIRAKVSRDGFVRSIDH